MPLKYQTQMMLHNTLCIIIFEDTTLPFISEYLTEAHIKSSLEKWRDVYFYEVTSSHTSASHFHDNAAEKAGDGCRLLTHMRL